MLKLDVDLAVVQESALLLVLNLTNRLTDEIPSLALRLQQDLAEDAAIDFVTTGASAAEASKVKFLQPFMMMP